MKNIATLTALLMTLCSFCQITPTKEQQKKILQLTTPEKLIEYSKGLSNEKRQAKVIDSLQSEVKKRDKYIISLVEEHKKEILSIARNNNTAIDSNEEIDSIDEKISNVDFLKKINLYGSIEFPQFNFDKPTINLDLMFNLEKLKLEFGFRGTSNPYMSELKYNYSAILRYNFF